MRACDEARQRILDASNTLGNGVDANGKNYAQLRDDAIDSSKNLASDSQILYQTGATNGAVGGPSKRVANAVVEVIESAKQAAAAIEDADGKKAVLDRAEQVATASANMVGHAKKVAENPSAVNKQQMTVAFKEISNAMGKMVRAIKDADVGDKATRVAAQQISKTQADLDAATIFAETGQLHLGVDKKPLGDAHRDFTEAVKEFETVSNRVKQAGKLSSNEMCESFQDLSNATSKLAEASKSVAVVLGEYETQKVVLKNAKQVAVRAQQLLLTGNRVNGTPDDADAQRNLKAAGLDVDEEIQNLLLHVNDVAGEALEEIRAVDAAKKGDRRSNRKL